MRPRFSRLMPVAAALALAACNSSMPSKPGPPTSLDGMAVIQAKGKRTVLGSDDALAKKSEETPPLPVAFDYDFRMDSTEITQARYQALTGLNPVAEASGRGADFPISNVTYYDAVLFCNARSKAAGLDTLYAYSGARMNAAGSAVLLEGLAIDYERDGFRLPTEAEWEFAARAGSETAFAWGPGFDSVEAGKAAWHAGNSGGRAHPVGRLAANAFGLRDMLGNVMEWVNDWKQPYVAGPIRDFLGNRDPGIIQERSVKGGSYAYDGRYLRFASRSANYPTLGGAAVEYIGFRCVRGPIHGGRYIAGGEAHGATPAVLVEAAKGPACFGHDQVKLAFINTTSATRTLCYIDYSESPIVVREFLDDSLVFHPAISPDGRWVAYGDREEGDARPGTVSVRLLKPGSPIVRLAVPSAAIPRWRVAEAETLLYYAATARDNTDPAWQGEGTFAVTMRGGAPFGEPRPVASRGGYHDGWSQDGARLYTGFRNLKMNVLARDSAVVLFTGPRNGKTAGDTSQVCNVSIEPGASGVPDALLLDFGYQGRSSVVGRSYGLHEVLFRLNTENGEVRRWYGAPKGFAAWQDVEWSNHPGFAVASGEDMNLGYPAVLAANLGDSSTTVLARGENLRQPCLWLKPGAVVPSREDKAIDDSLGRYNVLPKDFSQEMFANKMRAFWLQRHAGEVVGVGTSHLAFGMRPAAFSHFRAVNLGTAGAPVGVNSGVLRNYVLPHYDHLRAVVFDVLLGNLFFPFDVTPVWNDALGHAYDRHHGYWKTAVPAVMDSVMRFGRIEATAGEYDSLGGGGYFIFPGTGWGADPPPNFVQGSGALPDPLAEASLTALEALAREVADRGVLFVMVVFPESPNYLHTPYYAKHGPARADGRTLVTGIERFCAQIPNCRLYDANLEGSHDYAPTDFSDEDHLNAAGAGKLSHRLDSLIFQALDQNR